MGLLFEGFVPVDALDALSLSLFSSSSKQFNIPLWLDSHTLSMAEGNQFMEHIVQGLVFCGADPSYGGSGKELLVEVSWRVLHPRFHTCDYSQWYSFMCTTIFFF